MLKQCLENIAEGSLHRCISSISILLQNHHKTNYSYIIYMVLYTSWQGIMTSSNGSLNQNHDRCNEKCDETWVYRLRKELKFFAGFEFSD